MDTLCGHRRAHRGRRAGAAARRLAPALRRDAPRLDRSRARQLADARSALFVAPGVITVSSSCLTGRETEALLFAVRRAGRRAAPASCTDAAQASRRIRCDLVHEDVPPTSIVIGLAPRARSSTCRTCCASASSRRLLGPGRGDPASLGEDRAARGKEGELFPGSGKDGEAGTQLIEPACAAGREPRCALALHADHRPE